MGGKSYPCYGGSFFLRTPIRKYRRRKSESQEAPFLTDESRDRQREQRSFFREETSSTREGYLDIFALVLNGYLLEDDGK